MHLLVCAHLNNIFLFFKAVELRYFIHPKRLGDVCRFHSFIFKLNTLWLLTHWTCVHPILCVHLIIFLGLLNLTLLRLHHLWSAYIVYLCVICNSNRFYSFIFKLCITIVHTLKMCTGDAGPEQSSVLFRCTIEFISCQLSSCKQFTYDST